MRTLVQKLLVTQAILLAALASYPLSGMLPKELPEAFDIQLESPHFSNGVLSTDKGGTFKGKDLFIQAQNIRYTHTKDVNKLEADGDLFMQFKNRPYKGDKVEINLDTNKATIWQGCTEADEWYIGGRVIEILPDGKALFHDAYVTTSENEQNDWSIEASRVEVLPGDKLSTENVRFYFIRMPLLWVPKYTMNLAEEKSAPFSYRFRWGGSEGARIGATYGFSSFSNWKTKLVLDYNFKYGLGGGLVANWKNPSKYSSFQSLWYIAQARNKTWKSARYRLQGFYIKSWVEQDVHLRAMYDKLSDRQMKTDFADHTINDAVVGKTEAKLWKNTENWIGSIDARVRVNNFQDVKQELPLLIFNTRPQVLGSSGIVLESKLSAGYLDYVFAKQVPHVTNYASSRCEITQNMYRTLLLSPISITPRIGYHLIQYSSSPQHDQRFQALGTAGVDVKTRFIASNPYCCQILEPYVSYDYITQPQVRSHDHYVFDLEDGWAKLNTLRFGLKQHLMLTPNRNGFSRQLLFDLYARAFYSQHVYSMAIPKTYFDATFLASPWQTYTLSTAWDQDNKVLDHINLMGRFTVSDKLAFTLEWRKRSAFCWRKIDLENFVVDMVRPQHVLRHSEMSDKRQFARATFFWQIAENLDFEGGIRHGWGRHKSPNYTEWDLTLGTLVRGALVVKFTYEKRYHDTRYYFSFGLGQKRPSKQTTFKKIGFGNYDL